MPQSRKTTAGPYKPFLVVALLPNHLSTLHDVGMAMIRCAQRGYPKHILEIKGINALAKS